MTDGTPTPPASRVAAAAAGDAAALSDLWRDHRRWVAAILLAHMPRADDLDDLLQDVAMTMVARIGELRSEAGFKPWLRAIAINRARTAGRRSRTRTDAAASIAAASAAAHEPEADALPAAQEEGRALLELARQLPEQYREPLLLRCLSDMTYRQIGELLDIPDTTVETRIARARRMLRDLRDNADQRTRPTLPQRPGSSGPAATHPAAARGAP